MCARAPWLRYLLAVRVSHQRRAGNGSLLADVVDLARRQSAHRPAANVGGVLQDQPALPLGTEAVRRVEMLKERGLISEGEYTKEKAAIEKILAPNKPVVSKAAKAAATASASKGGPKPAVHLASFRSKQAATRAWTQLRRAHRSLLGKLKSEVTRVNIGRRKGVYYRLIAGPFKSTGAASQTCRRLKSRRQYCDTAFMSGG